MHQLLGMMAKKRVHLPEELIMEILLRLPLKTILRCKCVCKLWLSLISHPNFSISHFQLAASPTLRLLLFFGNYFFHKTLSIDFDASLNDDSAYASNDLDFIRPQHRPQIGGSCRGFVFLHSDRGVYIWNPSTGVHKQIPRSPITTLKDNNVLINYILKLLYGFAYEPSTDDYFVVLVSYDLGFFDPVPVSSWIDFKIFSLRANKWKQIECGFHLPYMVFNTINCHPKEVGLLPNDFNVGYFVKCDLLVLGRLISAWIVDMHTVEIWVMQEYAVYSSWTKTLVFSMHPNLVFSPVYFTNCGDIVGIDGHGKLLKFNDKGEILENHSYHSGFYDKYQTVVYTESLLSLPSDIEQG